MRYRELLEAPASNLAGRKFYHGTGTTAAAESIIVDGLQGRANTGRHFQAPVPGRVYMGTLEIAVITALGGIWMGHEMDEARLRGSRHGYVFEVLGENLIEVQPDEDSVGEFLHDHAKKIYKDETRYGRTYQVVDRYECDLPYGDVGRSIWQYIYNTVTDTQRRNIFQGYMAYYAAGGKRAVKNMPDWMKLELIERGAHVAHHGGVRPSRCWRIDKLRSKEIAKDCSNFFEIAEEIPLNQLAEKAPPGRKTQRFLRKAKKDFKKRYGDAWRHVLYATAWKMFGESQTEANKAKLTAELRAWRAENTPDAQIDFSTGSDDLEVDDLYVDPSARDKGQATALMNKLCELADRYGVVLSLRPVTKEEGQGPDDLGVWYSRWGFAWETRDGDLMMFRDPANRVLAETADVEQPFPGLTPELVARLQEIRHQCRVDNQGGGACHLVSEWIEDEFGWRRTSGTYTSRDYQDVAIAGHLWNILPDGSILDATADQTGEGHDIRVIAPDDPEYHRYRPEWYDDYHPGHEEYENEDFSKYREVYHPGFDASRYPAFNGEQDYDAGARLSKERGQHWWATDREQLERYLKDQRDQYGYDIRRGFQP